ncbi:unnamed protein product [Schistosoma turkestanicum]|nr:unnamed protein product [Schistosoma turkestanicum]
MSSDDNKKSSDDNQKSHEDVKKSYSSRVNFVIQEASKLEVSGISQLYNSVRQRMMDTGLLEDSRNLRNVIDAPWLDDEALQLKLYYQEAVTLWSTWPTPTGAVRIKSIRQQLNDKLLDLRQKWTEKINNCRVMDSRMAEKALKLKPTQYQELISFAFGQAEQQEQQPYYDHYHHRQLQQQQQQSTLPPQYPAPATCYPDYQSHHHSHPYDLQRQHHHHQRQRHRHHPYHEELPLASSSNNNSSSSYNTINQSQHNRSISYYIPSEDKRHTQGAIYQNYFPG